MVLRKLIAGAALCAALSTGAVAQFMQSLDDDFVVPEFNRPIHVLDNYEVVDRFGARVGDIEGFVGPSAVEATLAIVELDGLPIIDPDRCHLVPLENLALAGETFVLNISRERVVRLPIWKETDILKSLC